MTLLNDLPLQRLQFYVTTPYTCGYLEGRQAQSLIAMPQHLINTDIYGDLVQVGFRRSGKFTYRPHCENCKACVPVRLPVETFQPSRSQRRAWKHHANLVACTGGLEFSQEHYALYSAYQRARHAGGGMDADEPNQYHNFLMQSNVDSVLVEFREDGILRMVSLVDCLADGLSAVYTFYDSTVESASYGTYNIMWLVDWCRRIGRPYLYLGYWIAASRKMAYKAKFNPLEGLVEGEWQRLAGDITQP